jgi:hypothetical protein
MSGNGIRQRFVECKMTYPRRFDADVVCQQWNYDLYLVTRDNFRSGPFAGVCHFSWSEPCH